MIIQVDHLTRFTYEQPVSFSDHLLYLRPRESQGLRVTNATIQCQPDAKVRWMRDCFNNIVAVTSFGLNTATVLAFHLRMTLDIDEENPYDFILEPRATGFPLRYDEREKSALAPYMGHQSIPGSHRALDWFYQAVKEPNTSTDIIRFLSDINQAIRRDIAYTRRDEEGIRTPNETLALRSGSCRDMALLFIAISRQLNLAARFASGYLYEPPSADGDPSRNRASGAMHAWAEIYLPGAGWKGFDPTNGIMPDHHFITSAVANQPEWITPIQGKYYHKEHVPARMEVELTLNEVHP